MGFIHQSYTYWDKHSLKSLHAEFSIYALHTHSNTPANVCQAELGRYSLTINIQTRALTFFNHLKSRPQDTIQCKALQTQEMIPEKSPMCQLVLILRCLLSNTRWSVSQHCFPNTNQSEPNQNNAKIAIWNTGKKKLKPNADSHVLFSAKQRLWIGRISPYHQRQKAETDPKPV